MGRGLAELLDMPPYALAEDEKASSLLAGLNGLTERHRARCPAYARILAAAYPDATATDVGDVPYLPVGLFKALELRSIGDDEVWKVMTSSGTTTGVPSRVFLDVETARLQTQALASIMRHHLGSSRRPMLIVDHPGVLADRKRISARGAGILGMLSFGRDHLYALDERMDVDRERLAAWLRRHEGEELLVFGLTFMVWEYLCRPLEGSGLAMTRATLFHSGGWKKLEERAVSKEAFKAALYRTFGIERVHDFYGMVEQVGSVFVECVHGFLHPPSFADVIVRDVETWQPADVGARGVIEAVSLLPRSYPGHALLTEDLGTVHGMDDCPCGAMGKRFLVHGRVAHAELRGCSDTHERD